jgi:hypothetical protein
MAHAPFQQLRTTNMLKSSKNWGALLIACAALSTAHASETFTFHSGALNQENALETASFTLMFTTPAALTDGTYFWSANNFGQPNTNIPPGVTFAFSDGYTTISDSSDLSPTFQFELTNGVMNQVNGTLGLYAEDPSNYDPYYGYTNFYIGSNSSQLQDVLNPQIIGID